MKTNELDVEKNKPKNIWQKSFEDVLLNVTKYHFAFLVEQTYVLCIFLSFAYILIICT